MKPTGWVAVLARLPAIGSVRVWLRPLMGSAMAPGHVELDAVALVEFLDGQATVNRAAKMGVAGLLYGRSDGGADGGGAG